jgi:ATP-dependent Lon protease
MVKKNSKNILIAKNVKNVEFNNFIGKKLDQVIDIIQRTYLSLSFCKQFDVFSKSSIGQCSDHLHTIYTTAKVLKDNIPINDSEMDSTLAIIQSIFDKLSIVFSTYGTYNINDVYYVVFGTKYNNYDTYDKENKYLNDKLELIEKYVLPIGYKNLPWTECNNDNDNINKITDYTLQIDKYPHLECFEPTSMYSSIHQSVFGMRILIRNTNDKKILCLLGLTKDIPLQYLLDNNYVNIRLAEIKESISSSDNNTDLIERWVDIISLKDILIYSTCDFQKRFDTMIKDVKYVKTNRVDTIIKKFFDLDLISRRKMLINLFTYNSDNEVQYIAYMLYDLIGSADNIDGTDNTEQMVLYESLPWKLKQYFKETMINTIEYTQDSLSQCDESKVSLEQQVLLMKADDKIKNRAKIKLKEIKQKSDDQGNKSKQYLEGLVRVPFGIIKKEPILCKMDELNELFTNLRNNVEIKIDNKEKYTLHEIKKSLNETNTSLLLTSIDNCKNKLSKTNKKELVQSLSVFIDSLTDEHKTKTGIIKSLTTYLNKARTDSELSNEVYKILKIICPNDMNSNINNKIIQMRDEIANVENSMIKINDYLDDSIYGHAKPKEQILKIMGQWINGEQKGYCFGFEGSPGVGKTSLAKRGLARCLEDDNGNTRPFSFISLGGSSNGSTLEGHNYTYVNSTWGKVVDILMDSKCMNPIIYIDELDKVSKTEQGREIIGILTHLIDGTQNDEFQDRFFSGIPFDLSKALFIFSYNDPDQIDRVLLDRIHRIRFDNLSWSDKIVVVNKFIMPELNEKMGFENTVKLTDEVIRHIIETFTMEPGVRKLKEVLFDLFGEINLKLLHYSKEDIGEIELPIEIKIEDFGKVYLKKQRKVSDLKIHSAPMIGTINGMWANALGKGGIIPIETRYYPSGTFFDLKLTGMQGDVMKESMTVAKTLAWSLTSDERKKELTKYFEETKHGVHVHCPEGATPKDGPSAGGAITLTIYSLLNNKPINNTISMTGETNLRGRITAIGGLDSKIIGSMRAGVKTILYPKENQDDFDDFMNKYKDVINVDEMTFCPVDTIEEAMDIVFK